MRLKINRSGFLLIIWAILLAVGTASAQMNPRPKRLLPPNAMVRGFIGGESQDRYVIRARRGQTMTVNIVWRRENDNRAEFSVSQGKSFDDSEVVKFGRESHGGKTWTGKIPATGNFFIMVVAHPDAHYTLRVTVR